MFFVLDTLFNIILRFQVMIFVFILKKNKEVMSKGDLDLDKTNKKEEIENIYWRDNFSSVPYKA